MMNLSRFFAKLPLRWERMTREMRKDTKLMLYDMRRMKKSSLSLIYQSVTFVVAIGSSTAYLLLNTYFNNKIYDRVVLEVDGYPIPMNDHLELLAIREWNFSHIARNAKLMGLLKFFPCKGSQPFSIGDLESRSGVLLGLPHNFSYRTIDDVNLKELKIVGQDVNKFIDNSKLDALNQLKEALVLSDKAKRFAITREIHLTNNFRVFTETVNILVSSLLGVGLGSHMIIKKNIRQRYLLSFAIRLSFATLGVCIWFIVRQAYHYSWNVAADAKAIHQGPDYYEGALEYYQKVMQKNAALYVLLGNEGQKMYTEDGEEKGLLSTVPSFKKRLEKIEEINPKDDEQKEDENKDGGSESS